MIVRLDQLSSQHAEFQVRCRIFTCIELEVYGSISEGSRHGGNFYKYAFHDVIVGKPVAFIRLSSRSQLLSPFQVIKLCGGIASTIAVLPFTISFSRITAHNRQFGYHQPSSVDFRIVRAFIFFSLRLQHLRGIRERVHFNL